MEKRYELVMDLWDSIDEEFLRKEMIRQGFEKEIERRVERIEKHPETLILWEEVKNKMKE